MQVCHVVSVQSVLCSVRCKLGFSCLLHGSQSRRDDKVCTCTHPEILCTNECLSRDYRKEAWICHCQSVLAGSSTEVEQQQDKSRHQIS